ncbi:hypothetical protein GH714_033621 [Hevea brasiliensis]|uniref:Uncharacterized protein n=1 Tax=Hevea brasiliensis TaxID=3981 RepID=A0A6A6MM65_HEVBR|nr:hypothetical protein GH714_033621 [Hevea brasiliensis]
MQLRPTIEFRNATDVIWQIPDLAKAVIFLAHGCNGRAVNFWDRSPSCPNCVGLPEERLLVLHALVHKFAVLTISSMGSLRFSSIIIMIAEGIFDQMDVTENYPPTLFVHMPKDLYRQQKISEFIEVLKNKGIDVAEVECLEFPLSPFFLADRIPGLNQTVSAKLFKLFGDKGFIDRKGYMMKDGRATHWKEALHETKEIVLDKNLVQHVQEELNLAFAYHEMTSLQSEQFFKWFESHMK